MSRVGKEILAMTLVVIVSLVGFGLFGYFVSRASCFTAWERSGMKYDYKLFGGCIIQLKDGTWLPAKNYREVP